MRIGYARVSTDDQDSSLQIDALDAAGCGRVFTDVLPGARPDRPGLAEALSHLREGDSLVVWRLDRLGRSLGHLIELMGQLQARGAGFVSLTESIDTTTPAGKLVFHVFGALAEFERNLIRERTQAGLVAARKRGRVGGRPRKLAAGKLDGARTLLESGASRRDVAEALGVSVPTLYRWLPAAGRDHAGREQFAVHPEPGPT